MRRFVLSLSLTCAVLFAAGCGGSGDNSGNAGGVVHLAFWHGQGEEARSAIDRLIARFNSTHPKIHVGADSGGALADQMLEKVTTGLASGSYPDIAYIFGSQLANLARTDKVVDLTDVVHEKSFHWNDFWPAARSAATIDGRVRAIPAAYDTLVVLYNPDLFRVAGVAPPKAGWTWDDYRATAKRLTDASKNVYGAAWPTGGGEDTTWRLWPMIWQQGGDIFNADHTKTAFDTPGGVRALTLIGDMAAKDKSVFLDSDPSAARMAQLFASGKLGMLVTGPWTLPDLHKAHRDFAVAPLPGWSGNSTTIAGADTWVVFHHDSVRAKAAETFLKWFTSAQQDLAWDRASFSLPLRRTSAESPAYKRYARTVPGIETFLEHLADARSRPAVKAYPQVSHEVSDALVSVMLGRATPADALKQAAQKSDTALAGGVG